MYGLYIVWVCVAVYISSLRVHYTFYYVTLYIFVYFSSVVLFIHLDIIYSVSSTCIIYMLTNQ